MTPEPDIRKIYIRDRVYAEEVARITERMSGWPVLIQDCNFGKFLIWRQEPSGSEPA